MSPFAKAWSSSRPLPLTYRAEEPSAICPAVPGAAATFWFTNTSFTWSEIYPSNVSLIAVASVVLVLKKIYILAVMYLH